MGNIASTLYFLTESLTVRFFHPHTELQQTRAPLIVTTPSTDMPMIYNSGKPQISLEETFVLVCPMVSEISVHGSYGGKYLR